MGAPKKKTAVKTVNDQLAGFREVLEVLRAANVVPGELSDDQALVVMLKGHELGWKEIRSLENLYVAYDRDGTGRVVMRSGGMRALVQERGVGYIEPVTEECTEERAVVEAMRQDRHGSRVRRFVYTLQDAANNGLLLRQTWKSGANRRELLIASGTSAAATAMFSDVLAGVVYTAEQVAEMGGRKEPPPVESAPAPAADTHTSPITQPQSSEPPGESPQPVAVAADTETPRGPAAVASPPPAAATLGTTGRSLNQVQGWSTQTPPQPIMTFGVTLATLRTILNFSRAAGGSPRWQEGLGIVNDYLAGLGVDHRAQGAVRYLTELEGKALVERIRRRLEGGADEPPDTLPAPEAAPPATDDGGEAEKAALVAQFEEILATHGLTEYRADIIAFMVDAYDVETFAELIVADLHDALKQLRELVANPAVFLNALQRRRDRITA
jgi:hypothetical protein